MVATGNRKTAMRNLFLLTGLLCVLSQGAAASADDDLNTVLRDPTAATTPQEQQVVDGRCFVPQDGVVMSLLGVQMETDRGARGGTRSLNPNHHLNAVVLSEAKEARDALARAAREYAPDIYGLGTQVANGAYVQLGASPDFIEIAIKRDPDEKLRDVERTLKEKMAAEQSGRADAIRYAEGEYEKAMQAHLRALQVKRELERQQAAYQAATAPLAIRIALIEARADSICGKRTAP
jgi:hypothetical protein